MAKPPVCGTQLRQPQELTQSPGPGPPPPPSPPDTSHAGVLTSNDDGGGPHHAAPPPCQALPRGLTLTLPDHSAHGRIILTTQRAAPGSLHTSPENGGQLPGSPPVATLLSERTRGNRRDPREAAQGWELTPNRLWRLIFLVFVPRWHLSSSLQLPGPTRALMGCHFYWVNRVELLSEAQRPRACRAGYSLSSETLQVQHSRGPNNRSSLFMIREQKRERPESTDISPIALAGRHRSDTALCRQSYRETRFLLLCRRVSSSRRQGGGVTHSWRNTVIIWVNNSPSKDYLKNTLAN